MSIKNEQKWLFVGQVTAQSGIPVKTIRYYEDLGLIESVGRTKGGYRQFSPEVVTRLILIKRMQSLGLSLQEIKEILAVYNAGNPPNIEVREKLEEKLLQINQKIQQLRTLQVELMELLSG